MIIGLSGRMFESTHIWEHIEAAARYGYQCLAHKSTQVHPGISYDQLQSIKASIEERGLRSHILTSSTGNFAMRREEDCPGAIASFTRYVELAQMLNAPLVRVWPGWVPSALASDEQYDRAVRYLREAGRVAEGAGRRVVVDTHIGTLCDSIESALRFIEDVGMENVGLSLDPANLYMAGHLVKADDIARLGRHIFTVNVKDVVRLSGEDAPGSFHIGWYLDRIERFANVRLPEDLSAVFAERRVLQGGVDWYAVMKGLRAIGYDGAMVVDCAGGEGMPARAALARFSRHDLMTLIDPRHPDPRNWLHLSPDEPGMHTVVSPQISDCREVWIYRLNIPRGFTYKLITGPQEMNAAVTRGSLRVETAHFLETIGVKDSFYLPGMYKAELFAEEDTSVFIGAAPYEDVGAPYVRRFAETNGAFHRAMGTGAGACDIFYTLDANTPASRLICGITTAGDGQWSSWPPHRHEDGMEEAYCYFDMTRDRFGLHLNYPENDGIDDLCAHTIRDGAVVLAPQGYHTTVSTPNAHNTYFWVLVANSRANRRETVSYDEPAPVGGEAGKNRGLCLPDGDCIE